MPPLLLIVLVQAYVAAACGPVGARSPIVNTSGARARSHQRNKEDAGPPSPFATWSPTDEPELTPEDPTPSLTTTTELPPLFTFPPFDPERPDEEDKSLGPGKSSRNAFHKYSIQLQNCVNIN